METFKFQQEKIRENVLTNVTGVQKYRWCAPRSHLTVESRDIGSFFQYVDQMIEKGTSTITSLSQTLGL